MAARVLECPRVEPRLSAPYSGDHLRLRPDDEARDEVLRPVSRPNLRKPLQHLEILAIGSSGHVREAESVSHGRRLTGELLGQDCVESALLGLQSGAGVMCHQGGNSLIEALSPQPAGAVEGVEAGVNKVGAVADVVEPCRSHQHITFIPHPREEGDMPAWEHGLVHITRLIAPEDAPALAELLRVNREFLVPWEPIRSQDYFTADGQHAVIQADLQQHEQGSKLPHVILDDSGRVIGRA